MNQPAKSTPPESFGRYLLYPAIARGGMATVHTARLVGAEGFSRLVAAKRLHPQFTDDPDFVTMFHDEACIASRIHHPNVVPVLDVVVQGEELILVQEYVHGVPLNQLMKAASSDKQPIATDIVVAVLAGVLAGLHAAHEVKDEMDCALEIVHRDVSPQNVMVSVDGIPRLLDFGIAKARTSTHHTREGVFKGKLAYMAPEQLRMEEIDRTVDVYAAGVLAWEMLVNRRVYDGRHDIGFVTAVMAGEIPSITSALSELRDAMLIDDARWNDILALEPIVSRAMAPEVADRFASADEMLRALLEVRASATPMAVAEWVRGAGAEFLDQRQKTLSANEESWRRTSPFLPSPASGTLAVASGVQPIETRRLSSPPSAPPSYTMACASVPPSVTFPSAAPRDESGAYRIELGAAVPPSLAPGFPVAPLAPLAARMRASNVLPWVAAGMFAVAGLVGGLLRGNPEPPQPAMTAPPEAVPAAPTWATGPELTIPTIPASALAPATPPSPPATAAVAVAPLQRPTHAAPPPPPPARWVPAPPPPRATTPTPPAPLTSLPVASAASKADCNPPFFFDGTKKVFKPACL